MDFLDPKRKKSHRKRLLIGYLLMAVAVAMGTWLALVTANGFWVDRKTGDIIQNGTVFVDSQPVSGSVYLNGVLQGNKTATRLVLPGSKQYTVKLTANGYRDWTRTFTLEGGHIERLVYPLLLPKTLASTEDQLYAAAPVLTSQSPNKRWLLVQQAGQLNSFDLYDLDSLSPVPTALTIPANILTDATKPSTYRVVDWSSDNHRILLQRNFNDTSEYLMVDANSIASSLNINTTLTVAPSSVSLRDKKGDQVYIFDAVGGILRQGDLKNRTVSGALLSNVLSYKSFGSEIILYVTKTGGDAGKVNVRIRENDKATYLLKSITEATTYLLDISEFDGTPFYVVGTDLDAAAFVYKDPLPTLKGQQNRALLIPSVMRLNNVNFVSFSPNSQFIAAQSGNNIIVYDVEADRQFKITLNHLIDKSVKLPWADDYRFSFVDNEQSYIIDFDGSNEQVLLPSLNNGPYFTSDNKYVFTFAPSKTVTGRFSLNQTNLVKK